jgi:hypothetical protein
MKEQTTKLVDEAFALLGVNTFLNLSLAYSREDQKLMKSRTWDAYNPALITNQVKAILEQIDPNDLEEADCMWRNEILWFWHHHAISCERSRSRAQAYADKALALQSDDHPNRITRLLWLLAYDRVDDAKQWMADAPSDADPVEHQTGLDVIREYEQRKLWD